MEFEAGGGGVRAPGRRIEDCAEREAGSDGDRGLDRARQWRQQAWVRVGLDLGYFSQGKGILHLRIFSMSMRKFRSPAEITRQVSNLLMIDMCPLTLTVNLSA